MIHVNMYNLRQIVHKSIYTQLNIYLHTHNLHEYTWMETKSSLKKKMGNIYMTR